MSISVNLGCDYISEIDVTETTSYTLPCYANDMNCTYTITGDGREIQLSFENFDVEYEEDCWYDWVEVSLYFTKKQTIEGY